jgi:hypothetical protein
VSLELEPKDRYFTKLRNEIVDDGWLPVLKDSELRVYLVLARYVNREKEVSFPSVKRITELSGVNKNLICSATQGLVEKGLIRKHRTGEEFKYRNSYQIIKHPKIDVSKMPKRAKKTSHSLRGEDGKFRPIPKGTEKGIPSGTDTSIPNHSENLTCPSGSDKKRSKKIDLKENRRDKTLAASGCMKEQPSPPPLSNSSKSLKSISQETIEGFVKEMGLGRFKELLRKQGYDEREIQAL